MRLVTRCRQNGRNSEYTSRSRGLMERLRRGAERLGLRLDAAQEGRFARYHALLVEWNRRVNLTRVVEYEAVQERHFLDSLSCLLGFRDLLEREPAPRLIDVGSGAGFPGL